ncbi:hypothetical protein [Frigidibacter sp. MR17.24]|uniref:hypothetical protein n=1 Tax=Frigidibacter sp. MR17.24 TaxID=3127345 RepID=UPI003012A5D8
MLTFLGIFGLGAGLISAGAAVFLGSPLWIAALVFLGMGMSAPLVFVLVLVLFRGLDALAPAAGRAGRRHDEVADPARAPRRSGR